MCDHKAKYVEQFKMRISIERHGSGEKLASSTINLPYPGAGYFVGDESLLDKVTNHARREAGHLMRVVARKYGKGF